MKNPFDGSSCRPTANASSPSRVGSPADVLILDLEDSVDRSAQAAGARHGGRVHRRSGRQFAGAALFVRINPLDTPLAMADLAAVVVPGLAGILLPKTRSAADLHANGWATGWTRWKPGPASRRAAVRILPVATETPQAMLTMQSFASTPLPRLAGVTWGAEDLSAAIGAMSNRDENGAYSPLYDWAASLCLCAAAAADVPAIDTVHVDFRDTAALESACRASRRRGFRGRIAIHPDQVPTINQAYSPSADELAHAQRIVDAFAAAPEAGTLSLDGAMIDKPHLTQALRTLAQAG